LYELSVNASTWTSPSQSWLILRAATTAESSKKIEPTEVSTASDSDRGFEMSFLIKTEISSSI